jgi:diaminohydroxyphosphoribosylaminopyrimidine deaminase/5-amino-6-(5-phosphoribosylamino)uracil reductase
MFTEFDRFAMARALALAARGLETTDPNPRVGCVVARGDRVIGEGWHERAGEAHAEVAAIAAVRAAGAQTAGATAYVTLEPCSHYGRTPPCVNALIAAQFARVVFAVQDPNPLVAGRGAEALRNAGIVVQSGLMEAEAAELNVGFMKRMKSGRPWVRVKLAMSLDGRTALANGASQWITGEAAREDVQHWRARSSAIMTGVGTVLADDPRLNVRLAAEVPGQHRRQPMRVVLDSSLHTPSDARLFSGGGEVVILTAESAGDGAGSGAGAAPGIGASGSGAGVRRAHEMSPPTLHVVRPTTSRATQRDDSGAEDGYTHRRAALANSGARVEELPASGGRVDLAAALDRLGQLQVNELLVEAGPTLAGELLAQSRVDELLLYIAPKILGPQARPLVDIPELRDLAQAPGFALLDAERFGDDLRLRLRPR